MNEVVASDELVALRAATDADFADAGIERALRDNIERNYAGELPELPRGCERLAITVDGRLVGVLAYEREVPHTGAVMVHALAVAPEERGHAYASRALFALERVIEAAGAREFYARVPRGNGRGLYFMLRCGYGPVLDRAGADDGTTWFRRSEAALQPLTSERPRPATKPERPMRAATQTSKRAPAPSGGARRGGTPASRRGQSPAEA